MRREQNVVEPHRSLRRLRVSVRILGFDRRRVEKRGRGYRIAGEAEDIQRGEVDGEAQRRFAAEVLDGLGVEGCAPTWKLALVGVRFRNVGGSRTS